MAVFITGGGVKPKGLLPDGYIQIEYIEATGTQYIDTGIRLQNPVSEKTRYEILAQVSRTGKLQYTGANYCLIVGVSADGYYQILDKSSILAGGVNKIKIEAIPDGNSVLYIDDVQAATCFLNDSQSNIIVGLFKLGNPQNAWFSSADSITGKLYSAKVTIGNDLYLNAIPCKNPSGEIGVYDTVSEIFLGNVGTGIFIAGPEL